MSRMHRRARCCALGLLAATTAWAGLPAQEAHEGAEFQLRRQAWFNDQRAYPNREADWEGMMQTRQQVLARAGVRALSAYASSASGSWTPMGPYGFFGQGYWDSGPQVDAGRVDAIALHPTSAGTMFIASPNGGLWRTTTGGTNWTPLFDDQCTLQMSTVRIDPVNPSIMYASASRGSGAAGCAMFRSTDGGASWANWNGNLNFTAYGGGFINEFFIDPSSAGSTSSTTLMFNFSASGIYRSSNSGATWTHPLAFGYVTSIVALPGSSGIVFAGVADYATTSSLRSGVYRSADNGVTWVKLAVGNYSNSARFQLATSAAQPGSVWILAGEKDRSFGSLARWDDAQTQLSVLAGTGLDLSVSGRTHFGKQADYDLVIAVDPTTANRIYIAGVRGFRSIDGGATFTTMGTDIHCDWHTLVVDPRNVRQLYAGTDGGIFSSTDGGDSWTSRNAGLVISMYYPGISQHPSDPNIILGGLQDNGTIVSNGTQWYSSVSGGDGGFGAINFTSPGTVWTTCQWSTTTGPCIYRLTSGSLSRPNVTTGIAITDRAQFIPPLVMDPVTPTTLYFGTMKLYVTVNNGALWTALSGDLSKGTGRISAIAIALSDPKTIYVGTSDGNVQVSRNGGATWTLANTGIPNKTVTAFAIDRTNPARALVTVSGSGLAHVFLTTDAGLTWTSASGNLPDMPTNAVVMIDDGPNHFFVGTDVGVYETTDAGLTWNASPAGLPNVVVNDLSYSPATRQLVAATFGRGLFKYSLGNPAAVLRGDVNRDGAVNALDALLIQQALIGLQMPLGMTILPHGDANCDGRVDAADALIVLRAAVGLTTSGACVGTSR